ncbi:MAG: Ig-like domain-containing protein [Oscillospiraceae bacterium]|nr:Ig-like domain-containing protein [Oscillospiraceae bacterium]
MKNVSKVLSVVLALVMVLGLAVTASAAGGTMYAKIDTAENLSAGTYFMAAYRESYDSNDWSANPYHLFTGVNTDLYTTPYSFADGALTIKAGETYEAATVELVAVSGKANTYYVKYDGEYLYSKEYNNRKLGTTTTATEWVASNNPGGGINLTTTLSQGTVTMGTAAAASKMIRSYKNAGTLSYGLVFFKESLPVPATAISIDATANVMTGFSANLTAAVTPADSTDSVSWTSSNEEVATVNNGKIVGLKAGTATITATAGNVSDTCVVTVADNAWTIVDTSATGPVKLGLAQFAAGKMGYFNGATDNADYRLAVTEDADDAVDMYLEAVTGGYHLYFLDAANDNAKTYIEIYEFDNNGTMKGSLKLTTDAPASVYTYNEAVKTLVTTIGENSYYLGAYGTFANLSVSNTSYILEDDGSAKDAVDASQFPARLYQMKVSSVLLSNSTANVAVNDTLNLTATVNPSNASNPAVTWTSSDATIASVNNGVVTAHKVGTVTITATADGKSATCAVTVVPETIPAEKVELDKATAELVAGKELNLTGIVTPATSTDNIVWTSSDETIAKVVDGKVTALKAGTVTITATAGGKSASCTITIAAAPSKVPNTGDVSLVAPVAALLASAMSTVALVIKKKEF